MCKARRAGYATLSSQEQINSAAISGWPRTKEAATLFGARSQSSKRPPPPSPSTADKEIGGHPHAGTRAEIESEQTAVASGPPVRDRPGPLDRSRTTTWASTFFDARPRAPLHRGKGPSRRRPGRTDVERVRQERGARRRLLALPGTRLRRASPRLYRVRTLRKPWPGPGSPPLTCATAGPRAGDRSVQGERRDHPPPHRGRAAPQSSQRTSPPGRNFRHGNISTMHLWWARRPLAMSRAVVLAR